MTKLFLRIDFRADARVGPGKVRLLELIGETGSISSAARQMGNMSYRRAWKLIEALNTMFTEPVVTTKLGGKGGGGTELTPFGVQVIASYRDIEAAMADLVVRKLEPLQQRLTSP